MLPANGHKETVDEHRNKKQKTPGQQDGIVRTPVAYYRLPEYDPDEVYSCPIESPETQAEVARKCAEYHHDHRDGWDLSWPIKLELVQVNDDGAVWCSLGVWDIERETVPVFSARKSK